MNQNINYSLILEAFGEEKIQQRYEFIYKKMQEYIEIKKIQDKVYINKDLLNQAIVDYFVDIYRLKQFHAIDKVNITKIVSYEVYWLLRRKPMQVLLEDENLKFVNENFLTVFLAHELLNFDTEITTDIGEDLFLEYMKHISYHLKYRSVDKQNLELILYSFEVGKQMYREAVSIRMEDI